MGSLDTIREHANAYSLAELAGMVEEGHAFIAFLSRPAYTDRFIGAGHLRTIIGLPGELFVVEATINLKESLPHIYDDLKNPETSKWRERLRYLELRARGATYAQIGQISVFHYPDDLLEADLPPSHDGFTPA